MNDYNSLTLARHSAEKQTNKQGLCAKTNKSVSLQWNLRLAGSYPELGVLCAQWEGWNHTVALHPLHRCFFESVALFIWSPLQVLLFLVNTYWSDWKTVRKEVEFKTLFPQSTDCQERGDTMPCDGQRKDCQGRGDTMPCDGQRNDCQGRGDTMPCDGQ